MSAKHKIISDANAAESEKLPDDIALPRLFGIGLGCTIFLLFMIIPPPQGMPVEAWRVAAIVLLMAVWWMTEAIPIAATALVPMVAFPLLDVAPINDVAAPYAHPLVYMMLGGFMIGLAMESSNLHRRIALNVLTVAGRKPAHLVGGFMLATALLSMWISNTATAAMMLPIGMSVIGLLREDENLQTRARDARNLPVALLLGIAYSASLGGMATLIGTPPNAVLAGFVADHGGIQIGFAQWMILGVPLSMTLLVLSWLVLTKLAFPVGHEDLVGVRRLISEEKEKLGRMRKAEKRVAVIFLATALAWTARPFIEKLVPGSGLTDAGIAMAAALALFLVPKGGLKHRSLLEWGATRNLPWNVMVLIGGGLSLGAMVQGSGLADWVGNIFVNLDTLPLPALAVLGAILAMLVSHVTSNTATAATLVPLSVSVAASVAAPPLTLAIPVVLACSCALMIPVATPPNAIVYASGHLRVAQMAKAGAIIAALSLIIITVAVLTLAPLIFPSSTAGLGL